MLRLAVAPVVPQAIVEQVTSRDGDSGAGDSSGVADPFSPAAVANSQMRWVADAAKRGADAAAEPTVAAVDATASRTSGNAGSLLVGVLPLQLTKPVFTRGLLHASPWVASTTLDLLSLVLARFAWLVREVEALARETGRVDAVEAVAAAEVALEKAEEATGGGGAARDPEAQGLLREAERVLAKAEVESERTDDDVELGGGENGAVRRGAGGSGAGMENNREYDRWYSDTPPWVLATCAGVGAGLVLIVFQTVCQGVGKGCEGSTVRSLVDDDYKKPPPAKYGAAGTTPV